MGSRLKLQSEITFSTFVLSDRKWGGMCDLHSFLPSLWYHGVCVCVCGVCVCVCVCVYVMGDFNLPYPKMRKYFLPSSQGLEEAGILFCK